MPAPTSDVQSFRSVAVITVICAGAACAGSDAEISEIDGREIERQRVDDVGSAAKAEATWRADEPDGHVVTFEGSVGDRSVSEWVIAGRASSEEWSVTGIYRQIDLVLLGGGAVDVDVDVATGVPVSVRLDPQTGDDVDVVLVEYRALDRPDGCEAEAGSILDLGSEPIEVISPSSLRQPWTPFTVGGVFELIDEFDGAGHVVAVFDLETGAPLLVSFDPIIEAIDDEYALSVDVTFDGVTDDVDGQSTADEAQR